MPRALSFWCKIVFSHTYEFICSKVLNEFEQMHPCYVKIPLSFFASYVDNLLFPVLQPLGLPFFSSDYYTNYSLAFFPGVSALPQCRGWLKEQFSFLTYMKIWRSENLIPFGSILHSGGKSQWTNIPLWHTVGKAELLSSWPSCLCGEPIPGVSACSQSLVLGKNHHLSWSGVPVPGSS